MRRFAVFFLMLQSTYSPVYPPPVPPATNFRIIRIGGVNGYIQGEELLTAILEVSTHLRCAGYMQLIHIIISKVN